jgi:8-oxo-dGTP pyrophosphatase MutT (NUDIX family)
MRPAASVILVRDAADGVEVLLVQRGDAGDFPGLHVFPGGLVDREDSDPRLLTLSLRDAASAAALLSTPDAQPYFIAAIRECLEEVGVFLTTSDAALARRGEWQRQLMQRASRFAELAAELRPELATDAIGYFSHWVTPAGIPRRYDTRFLVARMPAGQDVRVDGREAVRADWLTPGAALAAHERNEIKLIFPTIRNLAGLQPFASVDELLRHTTFPREVPAMLPKIVNGEHGMRLLLPGDAGYDAA